jgi:hypothetical protein
MPAGNPAGYLPKPSGYKPRTKRSKLRPFQSPAMPKKMAPGSAKRQFLPTKGGAPGKGAQGAQQMLRAKRVSDFNSRMKAKTSGVVPNEGRSAKKGATYRPLRKGSLVGPYRSRRA